MRVNLLFGFLGSGKTTLVRRLLAERGGVVKTAVIVNEFGEVGVDGDILRGNAVDMIELNSGCLCCTLRGSLMLAVEELSRANVERIIVEATGVAQPGELTETLSDSSIRLRVDIGPLITIVDAAKFPKLIAMLGEFYAAQIENADIVIVNKADLVSVDELEEVGREVREINPGAEILFAEQCEVDTNYLLEAPSSARLGEGGAAALRTAHVHEHGEDERPAHAGAHAESFVLEAGGNPEEGRVEEFFHGLPDNVWRAKGFMTIGGRPRLVQYALGQLEISTAAGVPSERIVFIGRGMDLPAMEAQFAFAKRN
jgi:G3E family GTPase